MVTNHRSALVALVRRILDARRGHLTVGVIFDCGSSCVVCGKTDALHQEKPSFGHLGEEVHDELVGRLHRDATPGPVMPPRAASFVGVSEPPATMPETEAGLTSLENLLGQDWEDTI